MRKARYAVAQTADILPDTGYVVKLGADGGECALFYHLGRYHAVGSVCPHQNASLQNAPIERGRIICRRHGYAFDPQSGDCLTVGGYGLPVYAVDVENDTIYVSLWEFEEP